MVKLFRIPRVDKFKCQGFKWVLVCLLQVPVIQTLGQDDEQKLFLRGYLKDLVTFNFNEELDRTLIDNLVHNRINVSWFPGEHLSVKLGMRNRMMTGDFVQLIPNYKDFVDVDNDYFDLSWTIMDRNSIVIHSILDRAYLTWIKDDLEITAGRQRINWGLNLVWNPNDIFNTYSFFDFDYEERQGTDGIRVQYYTGVASSVELAGRIADRWDETTIGMLWKTNQWDYDIQFLTGIANEEVVLGLGWAGRIGNAGFKGEGTWFVNDKTTEENQFLGSISADYSFENSLYLHVSILYNSLGDVQPAINNFSSFSVEKLNVKSISPYTYSTFLQLNYNLHPLISGGIASIYYPGGSHDYFFSPSITFSLIQNLDFDLIGQYFVSESTAKLIFTRLKWSF